MDVMNGTLSIAATALRAERLRLDVIASNLANANSTRSPEGGPYKRRNVVLVPQQMEFDFASTLDQVAEQGARQGVTVSDVIEDVSPPRVVFDPGHPDANPDGYVAYPNVNPIMETVDLMNATRAYEANVQVVSATKRMAEAALAIGG